MVLVHPSQAGRLRSRVLIALIGLWCALAWPPPARAWTAQAPPAHPPASRVQLVVDLDGDGGLDRLWVNRRGLALQVSGLAQGRCDRSEVPPHRVPLLAAPGTLRAAGDDLVGFATVDLDNDGDLDLAGLSHNGALHAWQNQGSGRFSPLPPSPRTEPPSGRHLTQQDDSPGPDAVAPTSDGTHQGVISRALTTGTPRSCPAGSCTSRGSARTQSVVPSAPRAPPPPAFA